MLLLDLVRSNNHANVNEQDRKGNTVLMLASMRGYTEIARLLIEAGADLDLKNKKGKTALILAIECGCGEIATLLAQKLEQKTEEQQKEIQKLQETAKIAVKGAVKPYRSTPTQRLLRLRKLRGCR